MRRRYRRRTWRQRIGDRLLNGLPYASIPTILIGIPVIAVGSSLFYFGWVTAKRVLGKKDPDPSDLLGI